MKFIGDNLINIIQTIAIVASAILAFIGLTKSAKATKMNNGLLIAQHHSDLWLEFCRNDHLSRIFDESADAKNCSWQEKQFVNMIFIHMSESLSAQKKRVAYRIEGLEKDVVDLLEYPIPKAVWCEYSPYHDSFFVAFVNKAIDNGQKEKIIKKKRETKIKSHLARSKKRDLETATIKQEIKNNPN